MVDLKVVVSNRCAKVKQTGTDYSECPFYSKKDAHLPSFDCIRPENGKKAPTHSSSTEVVATDYSLKECQQNDIIDVHSFCFPLFSCFQIKGK